jgi:hypothetical protein
MPVTTAVMASEGPLSVTAHYDAMGFLAGFLDSGHSSAKLSMH